MNRPVVLCGLGRVGWRVLDFLRGAGVPVIVLDLHIKPDDPRLTGVQVIRGDCRDLQALAQIDFAAVRGVLIVTSDDLVNVSAALLIRRINPDCRIVVRMFNQNLINRLGHAIRNITALSVSALTAPLLAVSALTGDSLGAFKLDSGPQQIAEIQIVEGSELVGRKLNDLAGQFHLLILAHETANTNIQLLQHIPSGVALSPGDRVIVCGRPDDLEPLLATGNGDLFSSVLWASWLKRIGRTVRRTLGEIDLAVKLGTVALFVTLFGSTLVFRFGIGVDWADGIYQTVSIVATGSDLKGEGRDDWVKVFISFLKIAGAALIAGFTAIFTQYLVRAKLGGAFEARKIPDGGHIVVCGLGNVGFRCVEEFVRMGKQVVAIEKDAANTFAATVRRMGIAVIVGDATVAEVLRQARTDTARAVVAATSSELANLEIALLVRDKNPEQRVVVRLNDPQFAQAVREAANIKLALAIPALAAPAFAAALYGDRVQTLVSVGERTLAVVELQVQADDPCLHETSLLAAMVDYQFLPVAVTGQPPFSLDGIPKHYRLKTADLLTVVIELTDLERMLRREKARAEWDVVIDAHPALTSGSLVPIIRTVRGCSQEDAEALVKLPAFSVATQLTRGTAEELLSRIVRERATGRIVMSQQIESGSV